MDFTIFNGANRVLSAPPDWDEAKNGPCHSIPVMVTAYGSFVTAWRPSDEDIAKLKSGGLIYLHIFSGASMPPLALLVDDDFPPLRLDITCLGCGSVSKGDIFKSTQEVTCTCGKTFKVTQVSDDERTALEI